MVYVEMTVFDNSTCSRWHITITAVVWKFIRTIDTIPFAVAELTKVDAKTVITAPLPYSTHLVNKNLCTKLVTPRQVASKGNEAVREHLR